MPKKTLPKSKALELLKEIATKKKTALANENIKLIKQYKFGKKTLTVWRGVAIDKKGYAQGLAIDAFSGKDFKEERSGV